MPLGTYGGSVFDSLATTSEAIDVRWLKGDPKLPDLGEYRRLLDSVFFLYPSVEAANAGEGFGGTGFLVAVPLKSRPDVYVKYAVTNYHVAVEHGNSVIRINRKDGGFDTFESGPEEWEFIPGGPDVAAIPFNLPPNEYQVRFLTPDLLPKEEDKIGAGEDLFMIGRFIDYQGSETNQPALRFGNISIMTANIRVASTNYLGPSIVADMHNRTGFSGSPVFAYRTTGGQFLKAGDNMAEWELPAGHMMRLIGILWGQFPEAWEIKGKPARPDSQAAQVTDGAYVAGLSGMCCIAPGEAILEVLNLPDLVAKRNELEARHKTESKDLPEPQVK